MADPIVVITGASGNLGRALAAAFASRTAQLALIDRQRDRLEATYGAEDARRLYIAADLTNADAVEAAAKAVADRYGRVDVLCNIAGAFRMGPPVHETSDADWNFLFDINARTILHAARAFVPRMLAAGGGKVVNVGAFAAQKGSAGMAAYIASKSALQVIAVFAERSVRRVRLDVHDQIERTLIDSERLALLAVDLARPPLEPISNVRFP